MYGMHQIIPALAANKCAYLKFSFLSIQNTRQSSRVSLDGVSRKMKSKSKVPTHRDVDSFYRNVRYTDHAY